MPKQGWRFVRDVDYPSKLKMGWWCFDVDEYYIRIGTWPGASAARADTIAPRTYCIARESGEVVAKSLTQFSLKKAKIHALNALRDRLQKSLCAVESALADEHFIKDTQ